MSATKTMVLAGFGFALDRVAVGDFALCHLDIWIGDRKEILTSAKVCVVTSAQPTPLCLSPELSHDSARLAWIETRATTHLAGAKTLDGSDRR